MSDFDGRVLDKILAETIEKVENSKHAIDDINSQVTDECEKIRYELERINENVKLIIEKVDNFKYREQLARYELFLVNKDFKNHTEEDMKKAYELALELQVRYRELQNEEKMLRQQRDRLARRYRKLSDTARKASDLSLQISNVISYLTNNLNGVNSYVRKLQSREDLVVAIIKAQEDERKSIAREIHDGPAQAIANVVIRAEICKHLGSENAALLNELDGLVKTANTSLEDVRRVIFNLRPMHLDDLGLVYAIKKFCEEFEKQANITTEFVCTGDDRRFSNTIEISVYRIIQEILNNARKHSGADNITVKMDITPLSIGIKITDDGIGFDPEKVDDTKHFGLKGIKERVNLMEGTIDIVSAPNNGTSIAIQIPLS